MASLHSLPALREEGVLHVVVESPRGSTSKIRYDPQLQVFVLSRPLPLGLAYPHDWGFVPGTIAEDGDPLDALVLSEGTTYPGLVLTARAIGTVAVEQDSKTAPRGPDGRPKRERNDRVIAVPIPAPRASWGRPEDLPARVRQEIEQFFVNITVLEGKNISILGWRSPEDTMALIASKMRAPATKAQ